MSKKDIVANVKWIELKNKNMHYKNIHNLSGKTFLFIGKNALKV